MQIVTLPSGPIETNCYLVACEESKECWIIDPAPESTKEVLKQIVEKGWKPVAIILTHSHWDHFADLATLNETLKLPVYVHQLDTPNVEKPGSDQLPMFFQIKAAKPTHLLKGGEELPLGSHTFKVIHTPGHSPGGICLYEEKERVLFSGDTLFEGTMGNISFPQSDPDAMKESLNSLRKLPEETRVFPGHGESTRIGRESWLNQLDKMF